MLNHKTLVHAHSQKDIIRQKTHLTNRFFLFSSLLSIYH